ncbi:MAG: lipoprotein [Nitratireductor sp.]
MELDAVTYSTLKKLSTACLIVIMAIGLSSCGRRGALEAPNSNAVQTDDVSGEQAPAPTADRPFILDGII